MIRKESSDRVCAFCGAPATTEYKGVVCCGKCREKHAEFLGKSVKAFECKKP